MAKYGHRTVPIEFGAIPAPTAAGTAAGTVAVSNGGASGGGAPWSEAPLLISDLVSRYLVPSNAAPPGEAVAVAYLAQHALTTQLPLLAEEFEIPDVCGPPGGQVG